MHAVVSLVTTPHSLQTTRADEVTITHGERSSTKVLLKTVEPFKVISVTPGIALIDENERHNTVSVNRVTLAPGSDGPIDGTDQVVI